MFILDLQNDCGRNKTLEILKIARYSKQGYVVRIGRNDIICTQTRSLKGSLSNMKLFRARKGIPYGKRRLNWQQ